MIYEIAIDGRIRRVTLEPKREPNRPDSRFLIRVDDAVHEVDVRPTELGLSIVYLDTYRTVDVAVTERKPGDWLAELPHVAVAAEVDRHRFGGRGDDAATTQGPQRIVAPMPGRVVRILVKAGDEVAAQQGLVVVEAMKMENELKSPKAGRVREIGVTEGASVESGRLLIVVE